MSAVIDALNLNSSFFIQLAIFLFTFFCLKAFILKPFVEAALMRQERTLSDEAVANQIDLQIAQLEEEYRKAAQTMSARFKKIREDFEKEGELKFRELTDAAQKESAALLEKGRQELALSIAAQKIAIEGYRKEVVQALAEKFSPTESSGYNQVPLS